MGLGPPVCRECEILLDLDARGWFCPRCALKSPNEEGQYSDRGLLMYSPADQERIFQRTEKFKLGLKQRLDAMPVWMRKINNE